jgi:hypothetical protein
MKSQRAGALLLNLAYSQGSGSVFPLGTTPVTVTATDTGGNTATCTFSVSVQDTLPPTLSCPAAITVEAQAPAGAQVTYPQPTASDLFPVTLSASPPCHRHVPERHRLRRGDAGARHHLQPGVRDALPGGHHPAQRRGPGCGWQLRHLHLQRRGAAPAQRVTPRGDGPRDSLLGRGAHSRSREQAWRGHGTRSWSKDSKKYAATGGWGYAQFDDGKPADDELLKTCFPCHEAVKSRDDVFSRYSP